LAGLPCGSGSHAVPRQIRLGTWPEEPAEHLRFWAYLSALEQVTDAGEPELISEVLADPDQMMAQSAVTRHLDRRASELHRGPAYEPWAEMMTRTTTGSRS
jgi:hypothetical protein